MSKDTEARFKGSPTGQNRAIWILKIMMAFHYNILNEKESMSQSKHSKKEKKRREWRQGTEEEGKLFFTEKPANKCSRTNWNIKPLFYKNCDNSKWFRQKSMNTNEREASGE